MKNKNYICHMPYLRNSIAYNHDFWNTCAKWWCLRGFFHFFKILIFWVVSGVKVQKMAQNDKKLCLLHSISQEAYIIWLWFLVHLWNDDIFRYFFSFFQVVIFWDISGVKGQKMTQNGKKFCLTLCLGNCASYDCSVWYTYAKWWYLQQSFSYFQNYHFFGF